jgi:hypothetical protein
MNVFLADDLVAVRAYGPLSTPNSYDTYQAVGLEGAGMQPTPFRPKDWRRRGLEGGLRGILSGTATDPAPRGMRTSPAFRVATIFASSWLPGVPRALVDRHVRLLCTELVPLLADHEASFCTLP